MKYLQMLLMAIVLFACTTITIMAQGPRGKPAAGNITSEIIIMTVQTGGGPRHDLYLTDLSVVEWDSACTDVTLASTPELFDAISWVVVEIGIDLDSIQCTGNCSGAYVNVRVYTPACVTRTGTGCATQVAACDDEVLAYRDYVVCCDGFNPPIITHLYTEGQSCSGCCSSCQSTTGGLE